MKRRAPQFRWQKRKPATPPMSLRTVYTPRNSPVTAVVRTPDIGETPLSDAEVFHGLRRNLIACVVLREFPKARKGATS